MQKLKLTLTTDASGVASATTDRQVDGEVCGVYVEIGTLAATVDLTITQNDGQGQLPVFYVANVTASQWYAPAINDCDYATGIATSYTHEEVPVSGYITVSCVQGGASKTGSVYIFVED